MYVTYPDEITRLVPDQHSVTDMERITSTKISVLKNLATATTNTCVSVCACVCVKSVCACGCGVCVVNNHFFHSPAPEEKHPIPIVKKSI